MMVHHPVDGNLLIPTDSRSSFKTRSWRKLPGHHQPSYGRLRQRTPSDWTTEKARAHGRGASYSAPAAELGNVSARLLPQRINGDFTTSRIRAVLSERWTIREPCGVNGTRRGLHRTALQTIKAPGWLTVRSLPQDVEHTPSMIRRITEPALPLRSLSLERPPQR
jgi:hypothetical protein